MLANNKFENQDLEFWSNIKLLNQRLGYAKRSTKLNMNPGLVIPTEQQIIKVFSDEGLDSSKLIKDEHFTEYGSMLIQYMTYRNDVLTNYVKPRLMIKNQAQELFNQLRSNLKPQCPLPLNKQKGDKKDYAYLTCIVNMLIEANIGSQNCNYDPKELTAITKDGFPLRTLSRRVDGAFPSVIDPKAIWEIKEYYYTTTFGSRVADGVYETQLDGWELLELKTNFNIDIKHYLIVDDYFTWWIKGVSYLCRLIDSMHMGLVTEVIFGIEVTNRIPEIVKEWTDL